MGHVTSLDKQNRICTCGSTYRPRAVCCLGTKIFQSKHKNKRERERKKTHPSRATTPSRDPVHSRKLLSGILLVINLIHAASRQQTSLKARYLAETPSLISTDYPKSHDEFHVSSDEHSQPCFRGRQSAHLIFFFVTAVCISLSLSSRTHIVWARSLSLRVRDCRQTSFIPYIQPQRADAVCGSVRYICHDECSRSFWSENSAASECEHLHELTTNNPELWWTKRLQSSWVLGHMAHSLFILGFRFGASGGFGCLSDQSRGSRLICGGSVAEQVLLTAG